MSEQESNIGQDETASDDDVELHRKKNVMASDEPRGDDEADDDVELHGQKRKAL